MPENQCCYKRDRCSSQAVLPDGLDQLPMRKVLITVILTTVNGAEVCNSALNVNNNISDEPK